MAEVYNRSYLQTVPLVDFAIANVSKSDLTCYLFKSGSQTTAITLTENYCLPLKDRDFPLKIFIHGYTSDATSPWYKEFKKEYFLSGPHNILYVDWSTAADKEYMQSAANIQPISELIADVILNLKAPLEKVHIIGHSLGSHLAGFVGKQIYFKTGSKVGRITGTDPAGPGYEKASREFRLSKWDAHFVDVIHTDIGYFGIKAPIGHVDFYVNGGRHQPGCPARRVDENCSHGRSGTYFAESINRKNVVAKAARINERDMVVVLSRPNVTYFGEHTPSTARGIYYLKTNSSAPYLQQTSEKKLIKNVGDYSSGFIAHKVLLF